MVRIKPAFDGTGAEPEGSFYDGPPPTPGTYRGVVKRMALAKIGSGDNKGADRIALIVEITEGKFKGAGILHSLNITQQGKGWVNQFLNSLTDGSDRQKTALQKMFWQTGYDVEPEASGKLGQNFIVIGKKFNPIGKPCAFVTKMGSDNDGNPRAEIARFAVPVEIPEEEPDEDGDALDGLNEFKPPEESSPSETNGAATQSSQPVPVAAVPAPAEESPIDDDDDDDPWS